MPQRSVFPEFFARLDQAETAYILSKLSGKKRRLFSRMLQLQLFDKKSLGREFAKLSKSSFSVFCSGLMADLMELRGQFQSQASIIDNIHRLHSQAQAYQSSGKTSKAIEAYNEALELAEEAEEFEPALRMITVMEQLLPEGSEKLPVLEARKDSVSKAYHEIAGLVRVQFELRALKQLSGSQRHAQSSVILKSLIKAPQPQTTKGRVYLSRAIAFCYGFDGQNDAESSNYQAAFDAAIANTKLLQDHYFLDIASRTAVALSATLARNGMAIEAERRLEQFISTCASAGASIDKIIEIELLRIQLRKAIERTDWGQYDALASAFMDRINSQGKKTTTDHLRVAMEIALTNFEAKRIRQSLRWVNLVYKHRSNALLSYLVTTVGILELVCMYLLKDFEGMPTTLRNAIYLFNSKKQMNAYTKAILLAFKTVLKQPKEAKEVFSCLAASIEEIKHQDDYRLLIEIFDIGKWAKQHANGLP